jgi:hypothetical protein
VDDGGGGRRKLADADAFGSGEDVAVKPLSIIIEQKISSVVADVGATNVAAVGGMDRVVADAASAAAAAAVGGVSSSKVKDIDDATSTNERKVYDRDHSSPETDGSHAYSLR